MTGNPDITRLGKGCRQTGSRVARYKQGWFNSEPSRAARVERCKAMKKKQVTAERLMCFFRTTPGRNPPPKRKPVKATFDGVPYSGSLIKYGNPLHMLEVLKGIRKQTGKGPGDIIEVVVWRDEEVRTVEVPAQFENLMNKEGLLPVFKKLSYTR